MARDQGTISGGIGLGEVVRIGDIENRLEMIGDTEPGP